MPLPQGLLARVCLALAAAGALLATVRLGAQPFWVDEAGAVLPAKSILETGLPRAVADFDTMPWQEMFSCARMRVAETSIRYLRKPGKISAPAEPASTTVVAPRARQVGSGSTPRSEQTWFAALCWKALSTRRA